MFDLQKLTTEDGEVFQRACRKKKKKLPNLESTCSSVHSRFISFGLKITLVIPNLLMIREIC